MRVDFLKNNIKLTQLILSKINISKINSNLEEEKKNYSNISYPPTFSLSFISSEFRIVYLTKRNFITE